ncbi:hypothetical protein [Jannaschia aquimarina]|uniref:Tellurite resistance protein TerB n=1 Tax=Jannaschia aquimarina TaxID=935700 RepID=A0A0D1EL92_9RHOB|nr:hypothetical protein [Jannaschia aquimarina]KIT17741.1 hypothetical protein jaqu_04640 [Jannaschia aquimarina]SNS96533.1 hypothetical protein SAMN05421775_10441 [Jannaschia aquimarina]
MHFIIGLLGLAAAASFWLYRMRDAADTAHQVKDAAETAIGAVKRWNFKRTHHGNPADQIDRADLAQGTLAAVFMELGPPPTREDRNALLSALQRHLRIDLPAAEEILVIGHFFANECGSPEAAVPRIGKRLFKLEGERGLDPALAVINDATDGITDRQRDALAELKRIFRR